MSVTGMLDAAVATTGQLFIIEALQAYQQVTVLVLISGLWVNPPEAGTPGIWSCLFLAALDWLQHSH